MSLFKNLSGLMPFAFSLKTPIATPNQFDVPKYLLKSSGEIISNSSIYLEYFSLNSRLILLFSDFANLFVSQSCGLIFTKISDISIVF